MSTENKKIIVALDHINLKESLDYVKKASDLIWGVKIRGLILEHSIKIIREFKHYTNVMVDFKLYDIPSAIDEAIQQHIYYGADLTTVHCSSFFKPNISYQDNVLGVTILTSIDKENFKLFNSYKIKNVVKKMISFASNNNYGGIVCSTKELSIAQNYKEYLKMICPGIRPADYNILDDQSRISIPDIAIKNGADLIVIGRPITNAKDMVNATKVICESISKI